MVEFGCGTQVSNEEFSANFKKIINNENINFERTSFKARDIRTYIKKIDFLKNIS